MKIETRIEIAASPEVVWQILTDFSRYPAWNPFVKKIIGNPATDAQIKVYLPGMTFKPKVVRFEKNNAFVWKGKLLFRGIFDGEHQFLLTPLPNGHCMFSHNEMFSGILISLLRKKLQTDTAAGFEAMNRALKLEAEKWKAD